MKHDTIWQVRSQLNGCYIPDGFALFSSKRKALSYASELSHESDEHVKEIVGERVYFFVREDFQTVSKDNDTWPYMHVVEPVSWRDIAHDIGVKTRTEVLEYDYIF